MPELLSPAGNFDKLKTAIRYGADAVYLAGYKYGLRSGSDNFNGKELQAAVEYAHARDRKVYCALNAFFHNADFEDFVEYIRFLSRIGVDAVIVSDFGVATMIHSETNLRIHVSTQASVLNSQHAELWKRVGAKRVVLGREVSIDDAASIKKATGLEVEVFVHGAMCMSYSGHCTISNYTAGRDSNRGGCIQSCRHGYSGSHDDYATSDYLMSSKDLNALEHINTLYRLGIDSFKIEGRMKSLLYVATVTNAYAASLKQLRRGAVPDADYFSAELTKIPYRGYQDGSHVTDAGWDSVYRDRPSQEHAYQMAGHVIAKAGAGRVVFYATSKIHAGRHIEFIGANSRHTTVAMDTITDIAGTDTDMTRPNHLYILDVDIPVHSVARVRSIETPPSFVDQPDNRTAYTATA